MSLVMRSSFRQLYEERLPYIEELIYDSYEEYPEEFSRVLNMRTSSRMKEQDFMVAGYGLFPELTEGADITTDAISPSYSKDFVHAWYARAAEITKPALQDDQDSLMADQAAGLGFAARQTVETICANEVFSATAFTATGTGTGTAADQLSIYNTAHVISKTGETWSNSFAVDLDVPGLEAVLTSFATLKDESGKRIRMNAMHLIVPPQLMYQAVRLVESEGRPDTADNAINAFRNFNLRIIEGHYMTSTSAWFVWAAPSQIKAKFFWRQKLQVESEVDFWSKSGLTSADMRFSVGVSDPRGLVGSTG